MQEGSGSVARQNRQAQAGVAAVLRGAANHNAARTTVQQV